MLYVGCIVLPVNEQTLKYHKYTLNHHLRQMKHTLLTKDCTVNNHQHSSNHNLNNCSGDWRKAVPVYVNEHPSNDCCVWK